jgi:hypothetical protein
MVRLPKQNAFDFTGFVPRFGANCGMKKSKPSRRARMKPLEAGQIWKMAELNLQVESVGKLLVHYKLAKPNAIRIPNSVGGISTIEKFLKKNKAVLARS